MDPTAWLGLFTLIILEIVLGIDNLIFIAVLADKLPPNQRDRARIMGLSLALVMRLGLLASISWLVTLTEPFVEVAGRGISGRDVILLLGGLFLLFKATSELHERLEGRVHPTQKGPSRAKFWAVVTQIIVLDAVFSLDAVITAVGMVSHLSIMMIAVVVAMGVMLLASRVLTRFVEKHPTVVMLCLGFLLMIGLSLLIEGMGFYIPKGYLYGAIGFSVIIEMFNQLARSNRTRHLIGERPLRERTADAILNMLGGRPDAEEIGDDFAAITQVEEDKPVFAQDERVMIRGVLQLADRSVQSLMTPRPDLIWLDANTPQEQLLPKLANCTYTRLLLCDGELDKMLGVVETRQVLTHMLLGERLDLKALAEQPLVILEHTSALKVMTLLRQHPNPVVVVIDEYGGVEGVATLSDLLSAIVGDFATTGDPSTPLLTAGDNGSWILDASMPLEQLEALLSVELIEDDQEFYTLGGLVLEQLQHIPEMGETFELAGFSFRVLAVEGRRISQVEVSRLEQEEDDSG
ncbi:MAG TPA: TerC family protein [Cellvibrionaceae bacterium]